MKAEDPIVQDVRSAREKLFVMQGEDLGKLLDHYQDLEKLDQNNVVTNASNRRNSKTTPGAA